MRLLGGKACLGQSQSRKHGKARKGSKGWGSLGIKEEYMLTVGNTAERPPAPSQGQPLDYDIWRLLTLMKAVSVKCWGQKPDHSKLKTEWRLRQW